MTDVLMPRLSDSMQEGTILTWLAADGDDIVEGQELVEVETDKATMTQLSEASGALTIVVAEGTTIAVGEVIARLEPVGAQTQDTPMAGAGGGVVGGADPGGADAGGADPGGADPGGEAGGADAADGAGGGRRAPAARPEPVSAPVLSGNGHAAANGTKVPATPMARRIAGVHGSTWRR